MLEFQEEPFEDAKEEAWSFAYLAEGKVTGNVRDNEIVDIKHFSQSADRNFTRNR